MPNSVEELPSNLLHSKCVTVAVTFVVALVFAILPPFEEVILFFFHLAIATWNLEVLPGRLCHEQFLDSLLLLLSPQQSNASP